MMTKRVRRPAGDERGFTLLEMVVAISLIAITLLTLAYASYGAQNVLSASRHKTSFLELANAVVERTRARAYDDVGVNNSDPNLANYEGTAADPLSPARFGTPQRHAVLFATVVTAAPPAQYVCPGYSQCPAKALGLIEPFTVRRWITWTNKDGGTPTNADCVAPTALCFKRIDVEVEWVERSQKRTIRFNSIYYPGALGSPSAGAATTPVPNFTVAPSPSLQNTSGNAASGGCVAPVYCGKAGVTQFTFDGSGSTAGPSGTLPLTYDWDFGDGSLCTGCTATPSAKSYASPGIYTVGLTVHNSSNPIGTATLTRDIWIGNAKQATRLCVAPTPPENCNRQPTSVFTSTYDPASTTNNAPLPVSVNGGPSTDPDSDPLIYQWSWGDGTQTIRIASTHTYAASFAGSYTLRLTVWDPTWEPGDPAPAVSTQTITLSGVTCAIATGQAGTVAPFFNNGSATTNNTIRLRGNQVIQREDFTYQVQTNSQCTALKFSIPTAPASSGGLPSGAFTVTASTPTSTSADGIKTWTFSGNVATNTKFNSGGSQQATVTATTASTTTNQSVAFSAG